MSGLSLSLGKILGINVELHWTFIMLLLLMLLLSPYYFAIIVILFAFVLAHEMVHSIVAEKENVVVKKIVLYPFGGGSIISPKGLTPKKEAKIALSGPLASIVIALALWIISIIVGGPVGQFIYVLALVNLVLGVFNILPWLPLDGGRALRSYLQEKMGVVDATRKAVTYSNATNGAFVLAFTIYALLNSSYSLSYKSFFILFTFAIALFIYYGAQGELAYVITKDSVKGIKVRDAISGDYAIVDPGTKIFDLEKKWSTKKGHPHIILYKYSGSLYVLSNARLQGEMLRGRPSGLTVRSFGYKVDSIKDSDQLCDAIDVMNDGETNLLGVERGGKLIGILQRQRIDYIIGLRLSSKRKDIK